MADMSTKEPLSSYDRQTPVPSALRKTQSYEPFSEDRRDGALASGTAAPALLSPAGQAFLDRLLTLKLLTPSSVDQFLHLPGHPAEGYESADSLGQGLVRAGLLSEYQVDRVIAGTTHGLVMGNYQVLERLGSGGMSCVFLAEHCLMKRRVAVKVLPVVDDCPPSVRQRFYAEMRVLAELHHPNIVLALDAGELPSPGGRLPPLVYLVMELVSGGDLEQYILEHGPAPIGQACDWIRQAACGLQQAHDAHLIHRDIKPSNLLLTDRGQVKVVDFGLARQFSSDLTDPRSLLGSVEFMPPEQSFDPSAVGGEADVYGLGATLFWLLTGEPPYPVVPNVGAALRAIQQDEPRRVRSLRPEAPPELDEWVSRMLARDLRVRPATPLAVMSALAPFALAPQPISTIAEPVGARGAGETPAAQERAYQVATLSPEQRSRTGRVLIVDDEAVIRHVSRVILEAEGCECDEVESGEAALAAAAARPYDVVLLDLGLPGIDGLEVCRRLRASPPCAHLKIIVVSGRGDQNDLAEVLPHGADDYIPKPFQPLQLQGKVAHALLLKEAQDRASQLAEQLCLSNKQLEDSLHARSADVRQAQDALLLGMAKMAEARDSETPGHLRRLQLYCRCLAEKAALGSPWHGLVDARFLEHLDRCVPLHDIGKIGLPDEILLKVGRLTPDERALIETHPVVGDRILETLGREHGASLEFLGMARDIVRSHHERFDGCGYPDQLSGEAIPAAARLVAVADVYDALRRQRPHKSALSHQDAVRVILHESPGQFDPTLLAAFSGCRNEFMTIYRQTGD